MKNSLVAILSFCLFLNYNHAIAQSGGTDPSFNIKDDCTFGSGESFDAPAYVVALQSDGKIIAGGEFTSYNGVTRNRITRINTDGSLDQSFNPGTACNGMFSSYNPTIVHSIAIQSDGKILLGGNFLTYNGKSSNGLVRINSDGSIDNSFNIGSGLNAPAYKIAIQPDGKILVAGNFTTCNGVSRNRIVRLLSNGSIDTTFKPGTGFNNWVRTITILSNGKILAGGMFNTYNGNTSVRIARLNPNGSFDASFVTGTGFQSEVTTILPLANGKVIAMGHFLNYKSTFMNRIVRLVSNGNIDNTFSSGGSFDGGVYSAVIQPDGKIVAVGAFINFDNKVRNRICRLNSNGSLDTTFKPEVPYLVSEIIYSIAMQSNGQFIAVGKLLTYHEKNGLNNIARFNTDGTYEREFNYSNGFQVSEVSSFAIQPDQKIIAGGTFYSYNGFVSACVARLHPNGEIDSSFKSSIKHSSAVYTVNLQSDGKIIAGGGFVMKDNKPQRSIIRLNTDGTIDTTFKIGSGVNSLVYTTAIQSDGKIIIGGTFTLFKDSSVIRIVRVFPNGIIDTSFKTGLSFNDIVYKIQIQPDNKILICGRFTKYNNVAYSGIIRLLPNGSIDSTFNPGTGISNGFPASGTAFATALTMQSDGKIIMVGNFTKYNNWTINGIVRILPNGRYDSSFSVGPAFDAFPYNVIVQSDGKVLATGRFTTYRTISRNGIVRILPNGMIDQTFNPGTGFNRHTKGLSFHNGERILVGGDFTQYNGACRTRVARLFNCESLSKVVVSNCGPYSWIDGKTYNSSTKTPFIEINNGNYNGCDSFVVLNLTVNQPKYAQQVIKACGSYKWINGVTYNASNDTAKHIISGGAANGCDSIISLKLTINQPTIGYYPVIACKKYKWLDGNTYTESNNTATITYPGGSYNGCDSTLRLSLGIIKVTTTISKNLNYLTSNEFGATYQWLNCDSAKRPIQGATDRTYIASITGNYAVIVTKDSCTDTSACIEVIVNNTSVNSFDVNNVSIYPNPSVGEFTLSSKTLNEYDYILVKDNIGRLVKSIPVSGTDTMLVDLKELNGLYTLELVKDNASVLRLKVIIVSN